MTDAERKALVERLRSYYRDLCGEAHEAADQIEADGQRIAELEAENERLRVLVSDLYDEDDCYYDHHGYCQAHGWFDTEATCPHKRACAALGEKA